MKKKLISLAIFAFFGFNASTYAGSCQSDIFQMYDQIYQYGSITTQNNTRLNYVNNVSGNETCKADGYYFHHFHCLLTWKMSNWGNTLICN